MLEKVREIIADQLSVDESSIQPETSLVKDLEADSLDFVELVMALEDAFDVKIEEDDTAKIVTAQDIIDFLKAQGVEEYDENSNYGVTSYRMSDFSGRHGLGGGAYTGGGCFQCRRPWDYCVRRGALGIHPWRDT